MTKMIFSTIVISFFISQINAIYYNDTVHIDYIKNDARALDYYHPIYEQTINFINRLNKSKIVNQKCKLSLRRLLVGIENRELWAFKFYESTGKHINGKLTGHVVNFGAYEHCVNFHKDESKNVDFDGNYCLLSIQTPELSTVKQTEGYKNYQTKLSDRSKRFIDFNIGNLHGLCMPSTCEINEIVVVANDMLRTYGMSVLPPKSCTTISESEPWTHLQLICFIILLSFILLCVLSLFHKENKFLSNFSLINNYNSIYHTNQNMMPYLDGLKFYILAWGISAHSVVLLGIMYSQPFSPVKEIQFSALLTGLLGRFVKAVDVLFFYGGFLTIYACHDIVKSGKMKYTLYSVFYTKYIRYAVAMAIIILITFILPHLGLGPYYSDYTNHLMQNCKENFWKNFLLISNFMSSQRLPDMCIIPSWHLSAEFQAYAFHYFLIYYMIVKPKLGFLLFVVQFIGVTIFKVFYIQYYNIPIFNNVWHLELHDLSSIEDTYFPSFLYYNVYSLGVLCGWLVKNNVKPKLMGKKWFRIFIWILVCSACFYAFYYPHSYDQIDQVPSRPKQIIWLFCFKISISLIYFWTFYTFFFGYSRVCRTLMSFKWFLPWSRLSLAISLHNFTYLHYSLASTRNIFVFDRLFIIKEIAVAFVMTWFVGNLVFLFFEAPINNIFKNYFGSKRRRDLSDKTEINNSTKSKIN